MNQFDWRKPERTLSITANLIVSWFVGASVPIVFDNASGNAFLLPIFTLGAPLALVDFLSLSFHFTALLLLLAYLLVVGLTIILGFLWLAGMKSPRVFWFLHVSIVAYCALGSLAVFILHGMGG